MSSGRALKAGGRSHGSTVGAPRWAGTGGAAAASIRLTPDWATRVGGDRMLLTVRVWNCVSGPLD